LSPTSCHFHSDFSAPYSHTFTIRVLSSASETKFHTHAREKAELNLFSFYFYIFRWQVERFRNEMQQTFPECNLPLFSSVTKFRFINSLPKYLIFDTFSNDLCCDSILHSTESKLKNICKNLIFDYPSNKGLLKNNFLIEIFNFSTPNLT
jgi:hypothetical protein